MVPRWNIDCVSLIRKKDGGVGCQQKFVGNFFNTRSSLLVNGSRVDIVVKRYCSP